MPSSNSVATTTEKANRLGYKHVCVNYLHMASHDCQYQEAIRQTHTHIHTPDRVPSFAVTFAKSLGQSPSQSLNLQVKVFHLAQFNLHSEQVGV